MNSFKVTIILLILLAILPIILIFSLKNIAGDKLLLNVYYGRIDNVEKILSSGYNPNTKADKDYYTYKIEFKSEFPYVTISSFWLYRNGDTALHILVLNRNRLPPNTVCTLIDILHKYNTDFNALDKRGEAPLLSGIVHSFNYDYSILKHYLSKKPNINRIYNNNSPLKAAILAGNIDIVKILIDNGADINTRDNDGMTLIYYAIYETDYNIFNYLLSNGATINIKDNEGITPLNYALQLKSKETLQTRAESLSVIINTLEKLEKGGEPHLNTDVQSETGACSTH